MAHEVESMFSAREIPWHGLGTITEDVLTAREAILTAGLDWAVRKEPMYVEALEPPRPIFVQDDSGVYVPAPDEYLRVSTIPDKYAVKRLSDGSVLGCGVGKDYHTFQNVEAFDLFDTVVDSGDAKYETAGALFGGKIIFILARLSRDILIAGDKLIPYMLLLSSHDGSTALRMLTTPVRVVCANTMRMALGQFESAWSVRHTENMRNRIAEAREALQMSWKYYDEFEVEVARLTEQTVTDFQVDKILAEVFPSKEGQTLNEKALGVRGLYESSPTIGDFKGTGWGLLNAVNEWELWASPVKKEEKRVERQARETVAGIGQPLTKKTHALLTGMR